MRDFGSLAESKQEGKAPAYVPRFLKTDSGAKPAAEGTSPAPTDSRFANLRQSPPSSGSFGFGKGGPGAQGSGASGAPSGGRDFGSFREAPRDFGGPREGGAPRSFGGGFRDSARPAPRDFGAPSGGSNTQLASRFANLKTEESEQPAPARDRGFGDRGFGDRNFGGDRGFGDRGFGQRFGGGFDRPRQGGGYSFHGTREVHDVSSLYSKSITDIVNTQASARVVPDERSRAEAEKKDEVESREALIASSKKIFEVAGMETALVTFRSNISKILDQYISDSSLNAHITAVKDIDKLTLVNRTLMISEAVKHIIESAFKFESKGDRLSAGFLINALRGPIGTGRNAEAPLSDENLVNALESLSNHQLALLEVNPDNTETAARLSEIVNEILTSTVTMEKKKKVGPLNKSLLKEKTTQLLGMNLLTEVAKKLKEAEEAMAREAEELIRKAEEERLQKLEEEKAALAAARAMEERRMGGVKSEAEIAAEEIVQSGLVGEELTEAVIEKILPFRSDGARALMKAVVMKAHEDGKINNKCSWLSEEQYGDALSALCYGRTRASVAALYGLQECFHEFGFPISDKGNPILDRVFRVLYDSDIMEEEPMMIWRNDTRDPTPGKDRALMDTDLFLTQLEEAEEESDEDEEDGDD